MEVITAMGNIVTNDRGQRLKSNRNITIYLHYRYITHVPLQYYIISGVIWERTVRLPYMTDPGIDLTI